VTARALPRVIVIPDPRFVKGARGKDLFSAENKSAPVAVIESLAAAALAGGADAIQLRAKGMPGPEVVSLGRRLAAACRACGALFFVNDDAAAAAACGADGVHVGPGDSAPAEARRLLGERGLVGVSVYTDTDLERAEEARADYVAVGAVYPTATKAVAVVGLDGVRRLRAKTRLPVVAIGGVDATNVAAAIEAGADGVAVISAVCGAGDPEAATRELCARVTAALEARSRRRGGAEGRSPSAERSGHDGGPQRQDPGA
jgi:thiamine-phosphate pyrophosphorylase